MFLLSKGAPLIRRIDGGYSAKKMGEGTDRSLVIGENKRGTYCWRQHSDE